jgi:hypothetical protein
MAVNNTGNQPKSKEFCSMLITLLNRRVKQTALLCLGYIYKYEKHMHVIVEQMKHWLSAN